MKVLHTIAGFGAKSGGTSTSTYDLLSAIHRVDEISRIDLLTPDVKDSSDHIMGDNESWIKVVDNDCVSPLAISRNLRSFLSSTDYDIYHTNGLWLYINHLTCSIAKVRNRPYIITPHGMLYPEALDRSGWKKRIMRKIWFDKDIHNASCIHATCDDEVNHIRNLGYNGPIALIGNPVFVPSYTKELFENRSAKSTACLNIAFLGRLHPIKKIENILYGVSLSERKDIVVSIMGKGDEEYENFLRSEAVRLGIEEQVRFIGFITGREKFKQLSETDALFVPSDMENFGMIIPESLIVGTPVMASLGTPWKALNDNRCGWWRDNTPECIASLINEILRLSPDEHRAMGHRGREYILRTYIDKKIASQMLSLYSWILGKGDKPDFVYE